MTGRRNWSRDRERQIVRDRGVDSVADMGVRFVPSAPRSKRSGWGSITAATRWLIENRQRLRDEGRHPVVELRREFGLKTKDACEAIRLASEADIRQ